MSDRLDVTVPELVDGMRLDRAVALLAGISRSVAADLVERGAVLLDGAPVTARATPLSAGAHLSVDLPPAATVQPSADPSVPFEVIHEDADLLVVDKPAGVVVHPGAGRQEGTLVSGLLARYPELASVGDPSRPGIVHRLDRGTSGLLVVARTPTAYESLVGQLSARSVGRRYVSLVTGHMAQDRGVVEAPIGRSNRTPTLMAVVADGRAARTGYRVLARLDEPVTSTLLVLTLETGRTHQIRVHLSAIGHPVVGDERYGSGDPQVDLAPGRLFLHAAELAVDHPRTAQRLAWHAALPPDLVAVLGWAPELPPG